MPVGAVEVVGRRARGREDQSPPLVEGQARPGVGAAAVASRRPPARCRGRTRPGAGWCGRPSAAGRCGRRRRGCRPASTAAPRGTTEPRMRRSRKKTPGVFRPMLTVRGSRPRKPSRRSTRPAWPKPAHRLPGARVERVEPVADGEVEAPVLAALPVHEPADARARTARRRRRGGSKLHFQLAGGRVEGEHAQPGRGRVEDAVGDHGLALHLRARERLAGVVGPGHLQPGHVARVDLRERAVAGLLRPAAVARPVVPGGRRGEQGRTRSACAWAGSTRPRRARASEQWIGAAVHSEV